MLLGRRSLPGQQGRSAKAAVPRPRLVAGRPGRSAALAVRAAANPVQGDKFDYIIVGGGAAGCVLANRLSADASKRVLVLEAGPSGDALEIAVPAGLTRLFKHPVLDWGLMSRTQKKLAREIYLARGRALGGSSCTNATLYHRGSAEDYDSWGLEGWGSKDVLPWFISAEDRAEGGNKYHGTGGLMRVEQPRYQNVLQDEFFSAAAAVGLKANDDFNAWDRSQDGYGEFQVTHSKGERADMYRMYLKPAMSRGNLKVLTGAKTTRIAFEKSSKGETRAQGVEFSTGGLLAERFSAQLAPGGEVVMAAGAVHTPHLLQLSGVGGAASLLEHGIQVMADLPGVGQNLQDHPACLYAARMKPEFDHLSVTSEIYDQKSNIKPSAVLKYLFGRNGPLATTGCDHGAFLSTSGKGQPDLQMRFVCGCALDPDGVSSYVKFGELKKQGLSWPAGITIQLLGVRAESKGTVGLKGADPFAAPDININYFSDPEGSDLRTLREGIKWSRKISESAPLAKYLSHEQYPGPRHATDAELDEYIFKTVHSGNALVGTCKMGTSVSDGSVVSSKDLRVFGISNLVVADSSVIPRIPGGQTGAPAVMVAERAAALLRGTATIGGGSSRAPVAV